MISRAANRTSSERSSAASLRPSIRVLNFSRVRSDAGILSIGVLLRGGRSPNRTSLVRLIRRGCTPTLFPASLGLHQYDRFMIAKIRSIVRNIAPETVKRFTEAGQALPLWTTEALTREDRDYLEEWENSICTRWQLSGQFSTNRK